MSAQFDNLVQAVSNIKTKADSLITLVNGLSSLIAQMKNDPEKLQQLADEMNAKANDLQAAVDANTLPPEPAAAKEQS